MHVDLFNQQVIRANPEIFSADDEEETCDDDVAEFADCFDIPWVS